MTENTLLHYYYSGTYKGEDTSVELIETDAVVDTTEGTKNLRAIVKHPRTPEVEGMLMLDEETNTISFCLVGGVDNPDIDEIHQVYRSVVATHLEFIKSGKAKAYDDDGNPVGHDGQCECCGAGCSVH